MARGMAGRSPSAQQPTNPANVNPRTGKPYKYTLKQLEKLQAGGKQLTPFQVKRLQEAGRIAPAPAAPTPQLTPEQQMQRVGATTASGIEQQLGYLQGQGQFNPGSFQEQMDKAYQNVLSRFETTTAPQFAREQAEFNQMAAERGLDPNSVAYKTLQQQLSQRQDAARQQAMLAAQEAAQEVQAQGFGQAAQQYKMPAEISQAFVPFYQQMGRQQELSSAQQFEAQQAAQKAELDKYLAQLGAQTQVRVGGMGQLTPQQRLDELTYEYMLKNQLQGGQQPQQPSTGNQIMGGIAQGVGAGLTSLFK